MKQTWIKKLRWGLVAALAVFGLSHRGSAAPVIEPAPLQVSRWFSERVAEVRLESGVRLVYVLPNALRPGRRLRLVFYTIPNGNSCEQTLGAAKDGVLDWRFDIQHVGAQIRRLRALRPDENIALVIAEADGYSWPAWRQKQGAEAPRQALACLAYARASLGRTPDVIDLAAHSGGGSFLWCILESPGGIPHDIERITFLDANYSFSDEAGHTQEFQRWLAGDPARRLTVLSYDDREVMLDGKPIVSPTGGTYRATERMAGALKARGRSLEESHVEGRRRWVDERGAVMFEVTDNPDRKILHTVLVGEWNGLLHGETVGGPQAASWGRYGPPRAYLEWIAPSPYQTPVMASTAAPPAGSRFLEQLAQLPFLEREAEIIRQICGTGSPRILWNWHPVTIRAKGADNLEHTAVFEVTPDYIGVGTETDWARVPMTPMAAQRIADHFRADLPTTRLADAIWEAAELKLDPRPLTFQRESPLSFLLHDQIIDQQRGSDRPKSLVAGIKKDLVLTNRLREQPNKVAIYGWHYPNGAPIQPLTIVHRDTYVDYSHGVRLVRRRVLVDGKEHDYRDLLTDPVLHPLVSGEGPISAPRYP